MGRNRLVVTPGQRSNRLEILAEVESRIQPCGTVARRVLCKCDCGNETTVDLSTFRTGHTASCGCLRREADVHAALTRATHGLSASKTYRTWNSMKQRCSNHNDPGYYLYGGRGITVCQRWQESFQAFVDDMGEKPSPNHSIDRYPDRDGPYSPENCRWATNKEQSRNTSRNVVLTHEGEALCLIEWSERLGIAFGTLHSRLRSGWTVEKTLSHPVMRTHA